MLQARGLKKPVIWKVVKGTVSDEKALSKVCKAIADHLAGPPTLPAPPLPFLDRPAWMLLTQPEPKKKD